MANMNELLELLDFGRVDSESETELDIKFLRTDDFDQFTRPENAVILGAKGSGKSALFEMFSKYEQQARNLAGDRIDDVFFVTGTGFKDVKELTTDDIQKLMVNPNFDFDETWQLYIAIKIAMKLGELGYCSGENLSEFLKQSGQLADFRVLPVLRGLWGLIIGTPLSGIDLEIKGVKVKIGGKRQIDTQDILLEINNLLEQENKDCWILFDKIDELFSNNYDRRKTCIESLFRVYLQFVHRYPRIKLKIFLRNDIWNTLQFVNKSHISDKIMELRWSKESLMALMIKRACSKKEILEYICNKTGISYEDILTKDNLDKCFYSIFDSQVYKGQNEAKVIDWMMARITDGLGGKYPRELINFGNVSKEIQRINYPEEDDFLISGNAIKEAYYKVSEVKCATYLSEFPSLQRHFERFRGLDKSSFEREELVVLMKGLKPNRDVMIQHLYEVGILFPIGGPSVNALKFEIPKLFRFGLGLVIRGRP